MASVFKRHIALPQDHGSWVFILSPLLIGIFAGGKYTASSFALTVAAMAAFLIRQPVAVAVKAYAGRRSRKDLPAARFWMMLYGILILLGIGELVAVGDSYVLFLAVPGVLVFAWHLYLVSRRQERRQAGVEILATGVLSLVAPAAYWLGVGEYRPLGWALWVLTWLQSAASIVYAYLRLDQREWKDLPPLDVRLRLGGRALLYTGFNLVVTLAAGLSGLLPLWIAVPYLLQFAETLYGALARPAVGFKPTAIGVRQLIVSTLFTILFIVTWRL
ncbi:MAG: YwiC-like family protein [Chloroflexota bacterium]